MRVPIRWPASAVATPLRPPAGRPRISGGTGRRTAARGGPRMPRRRLRAGRAWCSRRSAPAFAQAPGPARVRAGTGSRRPPPSRARAGRRRRRHRDPVRRGHGAVHVSRTPGGGHAGCPAPRRPGRALHRHDAARGAARGRHHLQPDRGVVGGPSRRRAERAASRRGRARPRPRARRGGVDPAVGRPHRDARRSGPPRRDRDRPRRRHPRR